jgi:hypothetical protein
LGRGSYLGTVEAPHERSAIEQAAKTAAYFTGMIRWFTVNGGDMKQLTIATVVVLLSAASVSGRQRSAPQAPWQ